MKESNYLNLTIDNYTSYHPSVVIPVFDTYLAKNVLFNQMETITPSLLF